MSATTFDSKSRVVGDLLGPNARERIVVPTFQRGYEWQKKHVEAFWKDILRFHKSRDMAGAAKKYFLGPIVVLNKSEDVMELLDGQQRLATATILLSVIRDLAQATQIPEGTDFARDTQTQLILKEGGGYALELGETDKTFFRDAIQSDKALKTTPKLRTHRNIKAARDVLIEYLNKEISPSNPTATLSVLKALRLTVRTDLVMACIPVESERDAFLIFETLNDRGLRLSVPDLLLNYLMREARPETDRNEIRELWTEMVERMGRRDINRFLRHLWVSKYGDLKTTDLFTAIKEQIEGSKIGCLDFARSCAEECEVYTQLISVDSTHLGTSATYVRRLLTDLDSQASLPLLLSAIQRLPAETFADVCRWVLVFITRYSVISHLDSSGSESVFFALAREIREMMKDSPDAAPRCAAHIKDTLIRNAPTDEQIKAAIPGLILSADEAGYVMGQIARHMQSASKEVAIDEANIEHIFPKHPVQQQWGGPENQERLEPYLWHIGNLLILGKRLNKGAGNKEFAEKRESYYRNSELQMVRQFAENYELWNEKTIEARAAKLTPIILAIWNFKNSSRV